MDLAQQVGQGNGTDVVVDGQMHPTGTSMRRSLPSSERKNLSPWGTSSQPQMAFTGADMSQRPARVPTLGPLSYSLPATPQGRDGRTSWDGGAADLAREAAEGWSVPPMPDDEEMLMAAQGRRGFACAVPSGCLAQNGELSHRTTENGSKPRYVERGGSPNGVMSAMGKVDHPIGEGMTNETQSMRNGLPPVPNRSTQKHPEGRARNDAATPKIRLDRNKFEDEMRSEVQECSEERRAIAAINVEALLEKMAAACVAAGVDLDPAMQTDITAVLAGRATPSVPVPSPPYSEVSPSAPATEPSSSSPGPGKSQGDATSAHAAPQWETWPTHHDSHSADRGQSTPPPRERSYTVPSPYPSGEAMTSVAADYSGGGLVPSRIDLTGREPTEPTTNTTTSTVPDTWRACSCGGHVETERSGAGRLRGRSEATTPEGPGLLAKISCKDDAMRVWKACWVCGPGSEGAPNGAVQEADELGKRADNSLMPRYPGISEATEDEGGNDEADTPSNLRSFPASNPNVFQELRSAATHNGDIGGSAVQVPWTEPTSTESKPTIDAPVGGTYTEGTGTDKYGSTPPVAPTVENGQEPSTMDGDVRDGVQGRGEDVHRALRSVERSGCDDDLDEWTDDTDPGYMIMAVSEEEFLLEQQGWRDRSIDTRCKGGEITPTNDLEKSGGGVTQSGRNGKEEARSRVNGRGRRSDYKRDDCSNQTRTHARLPSRDGHTSWDDIVDENADHSKANGKPNFTQREAMKMAQVVGQGGGEAGYGYGDLYDRDLEAAVAILDSGRYDMSGGDAGVGNEFSKWGNGNAPFEEGSVRLNGCRAGTDSTNQDAEVKRSSRVRENGHVSEWGEIDKLRREVEPRQGIHSVQAGTGSECMGDVRSTGRRSERRDNLAFSETPEGDGDGHGGVVASGARVDGLGRRSSAPGSYDPQPPVWPKSASEFVFSQELRETAGFLEALGGSDNSQRGKRQAKAPKAADEVLPVASARDQGNDHASAGNEEGYVRSGQEPLLPQKQGNGVDWGGKINQVNGVVESAILGLDTSYNIPLRESEISSGNRRLDSVGKGTGRAEGETADPEEEEEMEDLESFDLRVVYAKNKTGFQESKAFQWPEGSVVAGRYQVCGYIGTAAFSTALHCRDLRRQRGADLVCLKVVKNNKDFFDQSLDEIKLLQRIKTSGDPDEHRVLHMLDFFYFEEHLVIVSELLGENLYEFSKCVKEAGHPSFFTLPRLSKIARQCLQALSYINSLGLVHCDVKPENILLSHYGRAEVKLIDFGSSCFLTDRLTTYTQSRSYRAPEVVLGLPYGAKVDTWSLGAVVAELITGNVLFQSESVQTMLARMQGIIGPFPRWMLREGEEAHKYFTPYGYVYQRMEDDCEDAESEADSRLAGAKGQAVRRNSIASGSTGGRYAMLFPKRTSLRRRLRVDDDHFLEFVSKLLTLDPNLRLSAEDALRQPWIESSRNYTEAELWYPPGLYIPSDEEDSLRNGKDSRAMVGDDASAPATLPVNERRHSS